MTKCESNKQRPETNGENREDESPPLKRLRASTDGNNDDSQHAEKAENRYVGYKLSEGMKEEEKIPIVTTLPSPKELFDNYIAKRKPCILKGATLQQALATTASSSRSDQNPSPQNSNCYQEFATMQTWSDLSYLQAKAGSAKIHVEKRPNLQSRFGRAREEGEVILPFGTLIQKVLDPNNNNHEKERNYDDDDPQLYYLTTQPLQLDEEDRPAIVSSPVTSLTSDFTLRPALAGNLIPMNCNLWMGFDRGAKGSRSGLHHDFHDNLNCLLQGRKTFVLYSPDVALEMPTNGTIAQVHPNGRIWYQGDGECAPDGAEISSLVAFQAEKEKESAEAQLEAAEEAVRKGEPNAQERLEHAENALQEALEKVLDAEVGSNAGDDEEDDGEDKPFGSGVDWNKADWDNMEDDDDDGDGGDNEGPGDTKESDGKGDKKGAKEKLNNFCTLPSTDPSLERFPSAKVTLEAGDILYLPAGWFHEVTSYSTEGTCKSSQGEEDNDDKRNSNPYFHLGFNYWFHTPDGSTFEKPYTSDFWLHDWEQRMKPQ